MGKVALWTAGSQKDRHTGLPCSAPWCHRNPLRMFISHGRKHTHACPRHMACVVSTRGAKSDPHCRLFSISLPVGDRRHCSHLPAHPPPRAQAPDSRSQVGLICPVPVAGSWKCVGGPASAKSPVPLSPLRATADGEGTPFFPCEREKPS